MIDPMMHNLQEIIGIFGKNAVIIKSVHFNNDSVIAQHTPKRVENCSDH